MEPQKLAELTALLDRIANGYCRAVAGETDVEKYCTENFDDLLQVALHLRHFFQIPCHQLSELVSLGGRAETLSGKGE